MRDELSLVFEKEGEKIFRDGWEARNGYIEVILDRSPERIKSYFEQYGLKDLNEKEKIKGLIGYVSQDDLLIEELTVFENLYFNAKLCFDNLSEEEIVRRDIHIIFVSASV